MDGKNHKKKIAQSATQRVQRDGEVAYRCEVCAVTSSSKDSLQVHLNGAKHKKVITGLRGIPV